MKKRIRLKNFEDIVDIVKEVRTINGDVNLQKDRYTVDLKSILGVMSLDISEEVDAILISSYEDDVVKFENIMKKYEV